MMNRAFGVVVLLLTVACSQHNSPAKAPPEAAPLRIYLARHGQTDWNLQKRLQGQTDIPLNETGVGQARQLAQQLSPITIPRIYCSTLKRSFQTAETIAGGKIPVTALPELREQALGKFEGLYYEGGNPEAVAEYERRTADPNDTLDGGESTEQHFHRVQQAVQQILRENPGGSVLIVGHGGTNALILRELLSLTAAQANEISQSNTEVYLIDVFPEKAPLLWKLIPPGQRSEL